MSLLFYFKPHPVDYVQAPKEVEIAIVEDFLSKKKRKKREKDHKRWKERKELELLNLLDDILSEEN